MDRESFRVNFDIFDKRRLQLLQTQVTLSGSWRSLKQPFENDEVCSFQSPAEREGFNNAEIYLRGTE